MELNVNQNTISRYESEKVEADYKMLTAIADYFDVSVDYLLLKIWTNIPILRKFLFHRIRLRQSYHRLYDTPQA